MLSDTQLQRIRSGAIYSSDYATLGWFLLPLHAVTDGTCTCGDEACPSPGKHPRTAHGLKDASEDPADFEKWAGRWLDLNLGVHTGKSGLAVIDFDSPDALENLITLINAADREPVRRAILDAPTVKTAQGFHAYFKAPDIGLRPRAGFARSVDLRCGESYVVAPPSTHIGGVPYGWKVGKSVFEIPLCPLPPALVSLITEDSSRSTDSVECLPNGRRNIVLASIAGSLRKHGLSPAGIYDSLALLNDGGLFMEPLPDVELHTISNSIGSYATESPSLKLEPRSFREIVANPSPAPSYVVNRLFLKNQIGLLVGLPYSGKSTVGLDLAVSMAARLPALNNPAFAVPSKLRVLYVYGEQDSSLWESRLRTIAAYRGINEDDDLPVFLLPGYGLRINNPDHYNQLLDFSERFDINVSFFDPLPVLAGVEDENDATEVVRNVRIPLQAYTQSGRTAIGVHHAAKANVMQEPTSASQLVRGSGDYIAMTGSIMGLWRKPNSDTTKVLVQGRLSSPPAFRLVPADLGEEEEGEDPEALSTSNPPLRFDGDWSEEQQSRRLTRISEFLKSRQPVSASRREIQEATGISRATLVRDLNILLSGRQVTSLETGKNRRYVWIGGVEA